MTIDAASTIKLLESIEVLHPMLVPVHVFLDNARYHHAKLVREWLARPGCRIKLHFVPPYCPHLNPIKRLSGRPQECHAQQMLRHSGQFADATLDFLRDKFPPKLGDFCDSVTVRFSCHLTQRFSGHDVNRV